MRQLLALALLAVPVFAAEIQTQQFHGRIFQVVHANLTHDEIRLCFKNKNGTRYETFPALRTRFGSRLFAATNAGIFEAPDRPAGLLIADEGHSIIHPLNLSNGEGNFYLKPNGVFFLTANRAAVLESSAFAASLKTKHAKVLGATQSGPLLLDHGVIHPKFIADSPNVKLRSGIGVRANGTDVFLVLSDATNLYEFAVFFRDVLSCENALYLDGEISALDTRAKPSTNPRKFAGFIAVLAK